MATNTVPDPIRMVDTGVYSFFGYPIPKQVRAAKIMDDPFTNKREVWWAIHNDSTIHKIDFEHATEENILAVLAAMRLSC